MFILSNLHSTQDPGSGTTVLVRIIYYWPFALCCFGASVQTLWLLFLLLFFSCLASHDHLLQVDEYPPAVACQEIMCFALQFFSSHGSKTPSCATQPESGQNTDGPGKVSFIIQNVLLRMWQFFFFLQKDGNVFFSCSLQDGFTVMGGDLEINQPQNLPRHTSFSPCYWQPASSEESGVVRGVSGISWETIKASLITMINV